MVQEKIIARRGTTIRYAAVKKILYGRGALLRLLGIMAMFVAVVGGTLSSYSEELRSSQAQPPSERFEKRQFMIPMRDGVLLNTEVYLPKGPLKPVPILLTRTPYGLRHDEDGYHSSLGTAYAELASDGYIFVFQDIRGRYLSDGTFVMLRSPRSENEPMAIDGYVSEICWQDVIKPTDFHRQDGNRMRLRWLPRAPWRKKLSG